MPHLFAYRDFTQDLAPYEPPFYSIYPAFAILFDKTGVPLLKSIVKSCFIKMVYSIDFRWRIVSLIHIYNLDLNFLSDLFGPKPRSIRRWYLLFNTRGVVESTHATARSARWPNDVLNSVERYCKEHPTFYLEELKNFLEATYPSLPNVSLSTICRALNFDLQLSRKVLTKAAREAVPAEIRIYQAKLKSIYHYPSQIVFIDETSKDGRHAYRRYARSKRGTKAVVKLPFSRGKRVSIMAALCVQGFLTWETTRGTFTRLKFHKAFARRVIPKLNPWPLPNSIVIMDNAKIHMYKELEQSIHQVGARLLFLPPYSPQLNPIEVCFGRLKKWIQKKANLVFPLYPEMVLDVAMKRCTETSEGTKGEYSYCGYDERGLKETIFDSLCGKDKNDDI